LIRWVAALASGDMIGSISIALLVFRLYAGPLGYDPSQLWAGVGGFVVAWIVAAWTQGLYDKKILLGCARSLCVQGVIACALTFGIVLLLGFALKFIGTVSRVWLLAWATGAFCWVGGLRILWAHYLRQLLRRGLCLDRALVLAGSPGQAQRMADDLERESRGHIGVVSANAIPGTPHGPSIDWVEDTVRRGMIDRVIIARFEEAMAQSNALLARLARVAVDVTLIPDLAGLQAPVLQVDRIGMLPAIELALRPLSAVEAALKRAEDLFLSSVIMLLTSPVFIAVALAIKLDSPGPVMFRQLREGYHNRVIKVWKFRTMHHEVRDERAVRQTSRNDSRVTRVGRLLRRLSLDELPQLINVIRGEMSIVGPRPHALGMTAVGLPMTQVLEGYPARHRLKPGITGWAQINGCRGKVDSHEKLHRRVSLDCYYIDHWSLSFDVWIILRTFALVLFDSDAY
jgi:polysaccharide biosynthesis protein PslA